MAATQTHRTHLTRRGQTWQFRRRIPADLVPAVGRTEFARSLRTAKYREACRRAAFVEAEVERTLDWARAAMKMDTEELIRALCEKYFRGIIARDRKHRRSPTLRDEDFEHQSSEWTFVMGDEFERMTEHDRSTVEPAARELLEEAGRELTGDDFDRFCWELQRTYLLACRVCSDEWEGDFSGQPRMDDVPSTPGAEAPKTGKRLSEVIAAFIADHEGKSWTQKTGGMIKTELDRFLEIVGDKPIPEVTRDDIRKYRGCLRSFQLEWESSTPARP